MRFLERRVAAPAVDLRPAGQAGLHLVAQHVLRNAVLELLDEVRALGARADDRHVAPEDVPELRQLVEVRPPEEAAERRHARVVLARPDRAGLALGVVQHRAELDDRERLAVEAHALLPVEHRARRDVSRTSARDEPERDRQHEQRRAGDHDVDDALDDGVEALQRDVVDVDDRDAVEIFEARAQRDHLQQVGHDLDVHHSRLVLSRSSSICTCCSGGSAT